MSRCTGWFDRHDWGNWMLKEVTAFNALAGKREEVTYQYRQCKKCKKHQGELIE